MLPCYNFDKGTTISYITFAFSSIGLLPQYNMAFRDSLGYGNSCMRTEFPDRRGGLSPERPKMYTNSYKLAVELAVELRQNLRGGFSPERPQTNILNYKLPLCYGSGVSLVLIYVVAFHQK